MKIPLTFIGLFIISALFLGFEDTKSAHERSIPIERLTEAQDLWARKVIPLYDTYYIDIFPFSADVVPLRTIIHDLCQYFIILTLIYMLWERSTVEDFRYIVVYLSFIFADMVDYILTHNNPFAYFGPVPISFNTLSILFYSLISMYIYIKYGHHDNHSTGF